jgi:hypothetical protein
MPKDRRIRRLCKLEQENPAAYARLVAQRRGRKRAARYGAPPKPALCDLCQVRAATELDHCHGREKFRGWLCRQCNTALGSLGDTSESLQRATDYLRAAEIDMDRSPWAKIVNALGEVKSRKLLNCRKAYLLEQ